MIWPCVCLSAPHAQVFLSRKRQDFSCSNSMWILEDLKVNQGGSVQFGALYRVRHLASGSYLTIEPHPTMESRHQLTVSAQAACRSSRDAVFLLYPLDSDTMALASTTPVRLKHEATGLHRTGARHCRARMRSMWRECACQMPRMKSIPCGGCLSAGPESTPPPLFKNPK